MSIPQTKLPFVTLDVFTATPYAGNPLAIVRLPSGAPTLSQEEKQRIAAEFNLSETVFLHETPAGTTEPVVIDIFTAMQELPFAGHPTIGSGWYLLSQTGRDKIRLKTKAGEIPVTRTEGKVRLQVPIDFKSHGGYSHPAIKGDQPHLADQDYVNGLGGEEAVASIVKGMTFVLLQVSSEDALSRLRGYPNRLALPNLGAWDGLCGVYAFFKREDGVVRTRMFDGRLEDPATGSAASTLAGWLASQKGQGNWRIEIVQGVEMGRKSEIAVEVDIGQNGQVQRVQLEGAAVQVMEGTLLI